MSDHKAKSQKGMAAVGAAVVAFISRMRRRPGGGHEKRAVASDVRG
jgi:hypothetical protein